MKQQSSKRRTRGTSLRKVILTHPESFHQFSISCQDLQNLFSEDKLQDFSLSVYAYIYVVCINEMYI